MSNQNIDAAAIDAYMREHLHEGSVYGSAVEKQRDFAHAAYRQNDATGELFRELVGQKIARTLQSGKTFGNTASYDSSGNVRFAVAVRNDNGEIEAAPADVFTQHQRPNRNNDDDNGGSNGGPHVQQLPGGVMRVSLRSTERVPKDKKPPQRRMTVSRFNGR